MVSSSIKQQLGTVLTEYVYLQHMHSVPNHSGLGVYCKGFTGGCSVDQTVPEIPHQFVAIHKQSTIATGAGFLFIDRTTPCFETWILKTTDGSDAGLWFEACLEGSTEWIPKYEVCSLRKKLISGSAFGGCLKLCGLPFILNDVEWWGWNRSGASNS